jgi:hypothetical protein
VVWARDRDRGRPSPAAGTFTASYDTEGKLASEVYLNGMYANYTDNSVAKRPTFYVDNAVATQTQNGVTNDYYMDPAGRVRETISGAKKVITHYAGTGEAVAWSGVTQPGDVFGVLSPTFRRRHGLESGSFPIESVFSAVYLLRGDAMASHEVSVFASARASSCLKRDNYDQVSTTGTKSEPLFTDVKIAPLSLPAGSVSAHGHRVTAVEEAFLEAPHVKGRPNYYEDFVGFSVGPAVITLHATGSTHPFPAATEQRLLSLLYRRAGANSSILSS